MPRLRRQFYSVAPCGRDGPAHHTGDDIQGAESCTTVRVRQGKVAITDGPYVETKEQLGGHYVIEARDPEEAIQVAARIPGSWIECVEVRPIAGDEATLQALGFAEPVRAVTSSR